MSESNAVRRVTATELLDIRERAWRPRTDAVSLAAEALDEIPVRHREQALEVLGALHTAASSGAAAERVLRRWPAVQVLATAGVAAERYAKGTFWPKLIDILEIRPSQNFQKLWGEAFLENLEELALPTFDNDDDTGSKYVGRILLHSGMIQLIELLKHRRLARLRYISCRDIGLSDSQFFDFDAEVLPGAAAKVSGDRLTFWVVRPENDLHSGVAEYVAVEIGQTLTCHDDDDTVLATFFHQLGQRDVLSDAMCLIEDDRQLERAVLRPRKHVSVNLTQQERSGCDLNFLQHQLAQIYNHPSLARVETA